VCRNKYERTCNSKLREYELNFKQAVSTFAGIIVAAELNAW
jgi:hypothetical protein